MRVVSSKGLLKKLEIREGEGVLELGNLGGRGVLAVWEIQSGGGGVKNVCHPSGRGCIFSGITHSFYLNAYLGSLEPQTFGFPLDSCPDALPVSHADLDSSSTTFLITHTL